VVAALVCLCAATPAGAQGAGLSFYGFRAGATLAATDAQVRLLLGTGLSCQRSKADPRLQECRATVADPVVQTPVSIWLAAIDSLTGVVTVSATLPTADFVRWRDEIERAYGPQPATVQDAQGMAQWIFGTQMLRLTWRAGAGRVEASVSIVDGPVLDGWTLGGEGAPRIAKPRPPG
jgi:hypothetical protein